MVKVVVIAPGKIREKYCAEACAEYVKRLGAFCLPEIIEVKESALPDRPSAAEISSALSKEAERILAAVPEKAFVTVLAVEGRQASSEELAAVTEKAIMTHGTLCYIIGSSYGLDESVKKRADLLLSFSKMTFPHRLFRVMLLEAVYRSFTIIKGTEYHK